MYVYPQSVTYSYRWNVTLTCVVTAGIPRPLLIWRRQNDLNPIGQSAKVRVHHGVLTIISATKDDEGSMENTRHYFYRYFLPVGFYECIGSNTAGEDVKTTQLIYAGIR